MYYNGQIVYDIDTKRPVKVGSGDSDWAWDNVPKNTTHFLRVNPKHTLLPDSPTSSGLPSTLNINGLHYRYTEYNLEQVYEVALPKSVEEAARLMEEGLIFPAPCRSAERDLQK